MRDQKGVKRNKKRGKGPKTLGGEGSSDSTSQKKKGNLVVRAGKLGRGGTSKQKGPKRSSGERGVRNHGGQSIKRKKTQKKIPHVN